jgi:arsenite-transporting ATPase
MAIEETSDGLRALKEKNITVDRVIVNRMTPPPQEPCRWCEGRRRLEREAFLGLVRGVEGAGVALATVPAFGKEPRGLAALRGLGGHLTKPAARPGVRRSSGARRITAALPAGTGTADAAAIVPRGTELLLFGGKGGVGKTTCAAAAAITAAMSSPDLRVLLLSADPAHSVGDVLETPVSDDPRRIAGGPPNLLVRELDARQAFSALRDRLAEGIDELIVRTGGSAVDQQAMRDLLELAPPGVDELAAIIDVTETLGVNPGTGRDLVVIDTAPTGHALRLLEMPAVLHDWVKAMMAILLKYQPAVGLGGLGAVLLQLSQGLGRLRALLRDASRTRFAVVTRAASLPRAETLRLLARLRDASIPAPLVIVNAVGAGTCPRCRTERGRQQKEVLALSRELIRRRGAKPLLLLAPAVVPPPSGCADLRAFLTEWRPRRLTRQ